MAYDSGQGEMKHAVPGDGTSKPRRACIGTDVAVNHGPIGEPPGAAHIAWVTADGTQHRMDITEPEALLVQRILAACDLDNDDGLSVQRLEAVTLEVERERRRYLAEISGQVAVPPPGPSPAPIRTPNPLPPVEDVWDL
jgi:hypothetical protein